MEVQLSVPFFEAEVATASATTATNRGTSQRSVPSRRPSKNTADTATAVSTSPTSASSRGSRFLGKPPSPRTWRASNKRITHLTGVGNACATCWDIKRLTVHRTKDVENVGYVVRMVS